MKEVWLRVLFSLILSYLIYFASLKMKLLIPFLIFIMILFHISFNIGVSKFGFTKVAVFSSLLLVIIFSVILLI